MRRIIPSVLLLGSLASAASAQLSSPAIGNCTGSGLTVATTPITSGTSGYVEYNNGGLLGELSTTGSGSVVLSSGPTIAGTLTLTGGLLNMTTAGGSGQMLSFGGTNYGAPGNGSIGEVLQLFGTPGAASTGDVAIGVGPGTLWFNNATGDTFNWYIQGSQVAQIDSVGNLTANSVVGTTTNNAAPTGSVGEYICAQVTNGGTPTGCATNTSTAVSLSTGAAANVTSVSLTAGDWDCEGNVGYVVAATTLVSNLQAFISQGSATLPTSTTTNSGAESEWSATAAATLTLGQPVLTISRARELLSGTTTVYLEAQSTFTTSTAKAIGFISCRRER